MNDPNNETQVQCKPYKEEEVNSRWFWKNGLSIDETKMSTMIICLLICMAFAGFNYVMKGDITNNLTAIIQSLIYAIAGVNITNSVINNTSLLGRNNNIGIQNQNPTMMNSPTMMNGQTMMNSPTMMNGQTTYAQSPYTQQNTVIPPGVTSSPGVNTSQQQAGR